jgi:hypothetical protein
VTFQESTFFIRKPHNPKLVTASTHSAHRNLQHLAVLLFLLTGFVAARNSPPLPSSRWRSIQHKPGKPKEGGNHVKDLPEPFRAGETLNYRVAWGTFANAASVQLEVAERRNLFGWQTWHFRASGRTVSPARILFTIDDQFDSYTDSASLESRQYEVHLNEMGRQQDRVLRFVPVGQVSRAQGPGIAVPQGTRDPLGAIYSLRSVDWQRSPEVRAPVCDGHDVYEMRARLEAPDEPVTVDAGKFTASRVSIHLYQHGKEVGGTGFFVWVAHDGPRTPVLIQADLPFSSVRIELTSASK